MKFIFHTFNDHDSDDLKQMSVNMPEGIKIWVNAVYNDFWLKEMLLDNKIKLITAMKRNSNKAHEPYLKFIIFIYRKRIETSFSDIAKNMTKIIQMVTGNGSLIKLMMFILPILLINYTIN